MRATTSGLFCAAGLALLGLAPSAASAQVADWTQGWSGQATLYLWVPTINGSQQGPDGQPLDRPLDLGRALRPRHGLHGRGGLPEGHASASCSTRSMPTSAPMANGSRTASRPTSKTKLGFYTAAATYRVYDADRSFVDVYGGVRYFNTSLDFKLSTANLGAADLTEEPRLDRRHHRRPRRHAAQRALVGRGLRRRRRLRRQLRPELGALRRRQLRLHRPAGRARSATATCRSRSR